MLAKAPGNGNRVARSFAMARCALTTLFVAWAIAWVSPAAGAAGAEAWLRHAIEAACSSPARGPQAMAEAIPESSPLADEPLQAGGRTVGWKRRFELGGGGELRIERLAPGERLIRVTAEYWEPAPGGGIRPRLAAMAGEDCRLRLGRRLVYESGSRTPSALEKLGPSLEPTGEREPLNPPVPDGTDPGGVPVALVDSGVNYLLPGIGRRLARDGNGKILGYDYWDLDWRPFDANPAGSPFFLRRHGTRTASLLLREAPQARLVPYRYPRPDMDRMTDLVDHAAGLGVRIVNLSMGSNDRSEWAAFEAAARRHPRILFVLSAGNNGRNIDERPVFPAALALDNLITVTSSEPDGDVAPGSNWGARSVDLVVPAERVIVTGFDGDETFAAGSSYAAVRVAALAARLLARHPDWGAPELKAAILERALPAFADGPRMVSQGFMPRPDKAEQLRAPLERGPVRTEARRVLEGETLHPGAATDRTSGHRLRLAFGYFADTGWTFDALERHAARAAGILAACDIRLDEVEVHTLAGPQMYRYFHDAIGSDLVAKAGLPKPSVYFVRDTLQVEAFEAEAIGRRNSASRPALRYTVWMTEGTRDPGIALAHELAHVLMDSGAHVDRAGNLMRGETAPENTALTEQQCARMVRTGVRNGLLTGRQAP